MGSVAGNPVVGSGVGLGNAAVAIFSRSTGQGDINTTGVLIEWENTIRADSTGRITIASSLITLQGGRRYFCQCWLADERDANASGEIGFEFVYSDDSAITASDVGGSYNQIDTTDTVDSTVPDSVTPAVCVIDQLTTATIKVVSQGAAQNFSPDLGSKLVIWEF